AMLFRREARRLAPFGFGGGRSRAGLALNSRSLPPGALLLFNIELAYLFLHANVFDGITNFVCEADLLRHRLDDHDRGGDIGGTDVDIFDAENALPKRLASFQILHAIKLEGIGHFVKDALANLQP